MFLLAVAVPTLHNPMRLAQSANLLDILTRGNLIVGFAAGGSPVEYAGLGRDPSVRHEQMMHNLEVMERALDKKPEDPDYEWETAFEHGSLRTRIMPAAYHASRPKFARATQNDEGVVWTGRKGWYLFTARESADVIGPRLKLYADTLAECGHDQAFIDERLDWSLVQKQIIVAETDAEAERFARERMEEMGAHQKKNFAMTGDIKDGEHLKSVVGVSPQNPDEFLQRAMIVGSPETVAEQIEAFAAAGVRHMSLLFNFGFMTAGRVGPLARPVPGAGPAALRVRRFIPRGALRCTPPRARGRRGSPPCSPADADFGPACTARRRVRHHGLPRHPEAVRVVGRRRPGPRAGVLRAARASIRRG
jgi:alkanesulfonate monooxygenase SsuD/methylene tetrahydromethanopterin reductase-like flavin-dependent oxidoreductase (luciferase family)